MKTKENNGPFNIWTETEIIVEFNHCDPMRVVWHGNYLNYFETGRRTLLEEIGYDYNEMEESGYAFPIIDISARYLKPLHFRDRARIKAILVEYENRLKIQYEIRNARTAELATRGESTQMALNKITGESCFVCPKVLIEKVEAIINKKQKE